MPMDAHPILRQDADRASFADLSQELRDMVYGHLWRATPYLRPSRGVERHDVFDICYDKGIVPDLKQKPHLGLPQWLLTSKGVCYEGIKELLDNSYWNHHRVFDKDMNDLVSRLVNPSLAMRVTYQMKMNLRRNSTDQPLGARIGPNPEQQRVSASAAQLSSRVKHLTLDVQYLGDGFIGNYPPDTTWPVDLSAFDRINLDLESLTLCGHAPTWKDPRSALPNLRAAFATEMSRLGAVLLGQNTRMRVEEDVWTGPHLVYWKYEAVIKIKIVRL